MLAPPQRSFLRELLGEMQLCVADAVDDPRDRAALSLALPLHRLQPAKKGCQEVLLMHVGMELFLSRTPVGAKLMRRYVRDRRMTYRGVLWLNRLAAEAGTAWRVRASPDPNPRIRESDGAEVHAVQWTLHEGETLVAYLLVSFSNDHALHLRGGARQGTARSPRP